MTARDLAYYVDGLVEGRRGTLVQRQKDRSVWRVEKDGQVWFAKRGVTPKRRREIRRESESARVLEQVGFGPRVLGFADVASGAWLVTADAGRQFDGPSLEYVKRAWRINLQAVRAVAATVRRLHDLGFAMPDLTRDHVRLSAGRVLVIDAARVTRGPRPAPEQVRARDFAVLLSSLRSEWHDRLSRHLRVRFLRDGTGLRGERLRGLCAHVDRRMVRLARRTRWRHDHSEMSADYWVPWSEWTSNDEGYSPWTFEVLTALGPGIKVLRTLPDREVRSLEFAECFFMKVFPRTTEVWSPAMREVVAIDLFQRAGILVNRLAAYAEDVDKGSMVAVAAARGEPLDDLLRRGVSVAERRALAVQTARIWRRMRECGLRHRDAYPCHLFAAPWGNEPLRFELRLIDMTRAGRAPFPKERWFVKDAAALWHGLPKPPVTRTDAVRWLREYFRIGRLDARAKRFARRVAAKEARIAARQARKAKR